MRDLSKKAYSVFGALLMLEFLAQFYFMASAIFTIVAKVDQNDAQVLKGAVKNAEPYAALHDINGSIVIPITILILIGLSFASRYSWRTTGLTALLFLLMVIQFLLAGAGFAGAAVVAGLHGVNALLLVGLGGYLTGRNWVFRPQPQPAAAAPVSAPQHEPAATSVS